MVVFFGCLGARPGDVAWSGENEFCHMCYATGTFIYGHLAEHSLRRRRGIEALGKAARWVRTLDMARDIVDGCVVSGCECE